MSFQQGLSGLNAAARNLDVIGNNVANSNTVGYKGSTAAFADVFAAASFGTSSNAIGIGTSMSDVAQNFAQGNLTVSTNPLDIAINGRGFFRMSDNGTITYSRNGQFQVDKDGYVVNSTGQRLTGYAVNSAGQIVPSSPIDLQIDTADLAPVATTTADIELNLDSTKPTISAVFNQADTTTFTSSTSVTVYDSLGNPQTVTMYFVKSAANSYEVYGSLNGATATHLTGGATPNVAFGSTGALTAGSPIAMSLTLTNGAASPQALSLDLTGSTQYGSPFAVNSLTQDGNASGRLTGFSIGNDGIIQGRYSNGLTRAQGQIVLANFTNAQGLQPLGNSSWAETADSGQPLVGTANTGSFGGLQSGAIEDSNIDLTAELVAMITAQRVYQANAQTIKTQDSVLQTLVNLR